MLNLLQTGVYGNISNYIVRINICLELYSLICFQNLLIIFLILFFALYFVLSYLILERPRENI